MNRLKAVRFIPLVLIVVGVWAYHNSFQGPFIFDDVPNILENPTIRHLRPIREALSPPRQGGIAGRPVVNLSLAINHAFGGTRVWGYHALNLVVHILAGLTLFGIVRRTLLQPRLRGRFGAAATGLALSTATLWTVHPLQTESVSYIIQRSESMMGLFYLLTLYCFIRGAGSQRPRLWYGLCVAACALGMACKAVMVSAPLIVLLYDRTFISGSSRAAWRRHGWLLGALAATWCVLLSYFMPSTGTVGNPSFNPTIRTDWREYVLTQPEVVLKYLWLSVWPHPLCFDYYGLTARTWPSILLPALVIAALLAATVWAWRANSVWGFIGGYFFLILVPTSSVFPLDSPMYEHRMYLSLAAVMALITVGGFEAGRSLLHTQLRTRRVLEWGGAGALVFVLATLTIQRNRDYFSDLTIWEDTVGKCPNNPRAHNNVGLALDKVGRRQEAMGHYEQALQIQPDYAQARNNLGLALFIRGRLQEAIGQYEQALQIRPDFATAQNNLGNALFQAGKVPEAISHYEQALRIQPNYIEVHYNLANVLLRSGKVPEAISHYEEVLRIQPNYAEAHNNLGIALAQQGRLQEAIGHYEQALRLKPDFVQAQNNLARARAAP